MAELSIAGAVRLDITPIGDDRGFFARIFCADSFEARGLEAHWTQCNLSFTATRGTVRGLHFQRPPAAEAKLVRCIAGEVFDVIVDLRAGSPTLGRWHAETLGSRDRAAVYVPPGVAHGFQTLTDDVEMLYFHSANHDPRHEGGLNWEDSAVGIAWPLPATILSDRDVALPMLDALEPVRL